MKVLIAIDSFKGSLSSMEAGEAVRAGILNAAPQAEIVVRPLADGGEGTVQALTSAMSGRLEHVTVTGPLGGNVDCEYGIVAAEKTAVIEMAGAAGLTLVEADKRNPLYATTFGVGEVILDGIQKGCRRFIIGIGGSATNDGGVGMLQALGFGFSDEQGKAIAFGAKGLEKLASITTDQARTELAECEFLIACDVTNPLCGELGCSAVYGPKKGADTVMIQQMDRWLSAYAKLSERIFPAADMNIPGTGAAGGLGFAFLTFLRGRLNSGIEIVLKETCLEDYIKKADIVVTGEGRLDAQTAMGKAPAGVAGLAKKWDKPVVAFAGSVTREANACNKAGIDAYFPVLREITTLAEAMRPEQARINIMDTTEQVFRLWCTKGQ